MGVGNSDDRSDFGRTGKSGHSPILFASGDYKIGNGSG